jgi:hypothetical protein
MATTVGMCSMSARHKTFGRGYSFMIVAIVGNGIAEEPYIFQPV